MSEKQKIEIYEGELTMACHQITQRVAEKSGLAYNNAINYAIPELEAMARHMLNILVKNNPDKEIILIKKPTVA